MRGFDVSKRPPYDSAILDQAGAPSLAATSDQQIRCRRITCGSHRPVAAPRSGGL